MVGCFVFLYGIEYFPTFIQMRKKLKMHLDMVGEKCFLEILICLCQEGDRWSIS